MSHRLASAPFNTDYPTSTGHAVPARRAATLEEERGCHAWLAHVLDRNGSYAMQVAPADEEELAVLKSQYYAVCAETDAQLGRLFNFLRARGEWDRTVVVFTADHAEQVPKPTHALSALAWSHCHAKYLLLFFAPMLSKASERKAMQSLHRCSVLQSP